MDCIFHSEVINCHFYTLNVSLIVIFPFFLVYVNSRRVETSAVLERHCFNHIKMYLVGCFIYPVIHLKVKLMFLLN